MRSHPFLTRRRFRFVGVFILAAGLATGATLVAQRLGSSTKNAPRGLEAVGVHLTPATPPANAFRRADAIAIAKEDGLADPTLVSAAFGVASDTEYYSVGMNGKRHYFIRNRPVWVVTLTGSAWLPSVSPRRSGAPGNERRATPNHQLKVLVDGVTGKDLESFSYR